MEKFIFSSLKIFFWIFVGIIIKLILAKLKTKYINHFINYAINFIIFGIVPYFTGVNLWKYGLKKEALISILPVFAIVVLTSYCLTNYITKNYDFSFKEVFFPLTFMNTLYLGIPVTEYFVSSEATYYTIIYSVIVTVFKFTFGIYIIKKKFNILDLKFYLIIYVFLIAFLLNKTSIKIPKLMEEIHLSFSPFISPLMLCYIGYSLKWNDLISNIRLHIFINLLKVIIIFISGIALLYIINSIYTLDCRLFKSVILTSILPSAIINYLILEKMNIKTSFTLGEIFWGTAIVLFLLPYLSEILEIVLLILK
ncbi:MAG: hypothetical protein ABDH23_02135 [Endomicrobiia bacterium]